MAKPSKITVPVELKFTVRIGDQDVKLQDLADALTRAGLELQKLLALPEAEQVSPGRFIENRSYASAEPKITEVKD